MTEIMKEKSCGCIILKDGKVLIIGSRDDHGKLYWSFPKGHQEDGETNIETAFRETKEEVNLDVKIFDEKPIKTWHLMHNGTVHKEIILFIAKPLNDELKIQEAEVEKAEWVEINKAGKYFDEYYNDVWEEFLARFKNKLQVKIRKLTLNDTLGAAEVVIEGWKKAYKGIIDDDYLNSLNVEERAQRFVDYVGSENFMVAVLDEKVVGFYRLVYDNSFSPNIDYVDCELMAIYTHPDYKGLGIGGKMFRDVIKKLKNKNKTIMILWCLADNTDSIKFYEHMGGNIKEHKMIQVGGKEYKEVGIVYDLRKL